MVTLNITSFINKKSYIYSIGDVALPQPIALSSFFIFISLFIVYTLPMFGIIGASSILDGFILLAPPILIGIFLTTPMFGEQTFLEVFSALMSYWGEPNAWYDLVATEGKDEVYTPYYEILVSRNQELKILEELIKGNESILENYDVRTDFYRNIKGKGE